VIAGEESQLSVAVAVPVWDGAVDSSHSIVISAGQVITGGVESSTVIIWMQVMLLLELSVAVQVRVIIFS